MKIDLRDDVTPIANAIAEAVAAFQRGEFSGPGESVADIQQITLGYQFDQAAWPS